jgi:UDPglucose--hexose-1-phosphate uridylyltransferase
MRSIIPSAARPRFPRDSFQLNPSRRGRTIAGEENPPVPELRQNLATKEWVVIATERAKRPDLFSTARDRILTHQRPEHDPKCPFCPGNESETPADILRLPAAGPWQVRLFPNKFAALNRQGARVHCLDGLHRKLSGVGFHEVLIESPRHNTTPALQTPDQIALTLKAFQTRGRQIMDDPRIEQIFYFKNHGAGAGTSLEHPHSQLLALPMVPYDMRRRIDELRRTFDDDGVCPICQMVEMELADHERLVAQNDFFVAFIPYAAFSPFHLWIVPRRHGPTFLDQNAGELGRLGEILREIFAKLYHGLHDPDYNYVIRSAPVRDAASAYLHWYVSIVPRVTKSAGFELGSGMYINPSLPEESAKFLREQPADAL